MKKISLPKKSQEFIKKLEAGGFSAWAVGGGVRDLLLRKKTEGWDFTTNATPDEIQKLFPQSFYDNRFGTVKIPVGDEIYEITTFRTERGYSDRRHPDKIRWGKTLEEDLGRRDFTINALAFNGKKLVDLFGGIQDLERKIVKCVGDPDKRFSEDALRLIRAIRIATQLEFLIEKKTFQAITQNAPLLKAVSWERIRDELLKILATKYPADGIMLLRSSGLLHYILPELEKCFGVEQKSPKRHHLYDVGTHSILSLKNCPSDDPLVRFACLLHDIGKPVTFKKDNEGLITFYNHEVVGASIVKNIAKRLRFSKKQLEKLVTLVRWHQFSVDERQTDAALRRFIKRVGKENLKDILDLRIGDRVGGGARETSWRLKLFIKHLDEVQKQPFSVYDLKINGRDVMKILNIGPGPFVGKVLNSLFQEVEKDKKRNNWDYFRRRLGEIKKTIRSF